MGRRNAGYMINWWKKLLSFIKSEEEEIETRTEEQEEIPETINPPQVSTPCFKVELIRYSKGKHDILGKLYVEGKFYCFTLEATDAKLTRVPVGEYELGLKTDGGRHATYYFRYKDLHQGMLYLKGFEADRIPLIHEGNRDTDHPGSIIVGEQPFRENQAEQKREVWYSGPAYQELYPVLAQKIAANQKVCLHIVEEY